MNRQCAWCKEWMGAFQEGQLTTHGICDACLDEHLPKSVHRRTPVALALVAMLVSAGLVTWLMVTFLLWVTP